LHSLLVMADHSPHFTDVSLFYIGQLTTLRRLHLVDATISEHGLHALVGLSELEVLEMPCWQGMRPPGFMKALQALQALPKLKELDISVTYDDGIFESEDYDEFCSHLQEHYNDEHHTEDDVEFVKCISGFTGLRHLSLYGCSVAFTKGGRELLLTLRKELKFDSNFRETTNHQKYPPYYVGRGVYKDGNGTRPIFLETGKAKVITWANAWVVVAPEIEGWPALHARLTEEKPLRDMRIAFR
jgi:hypothetical protein